jgi:predicted GNAT family N-acyltransferase
VEAAIEDIDLHLPTCMPKTCDGDKEPAAPAASIAISRTDRELMEIGRLRYELFIERDGKPYRAADKAQRLFLEPVDKCSINFFGTIGNDCVIAVRSTRIADVECDERLSRVVDKSALPADQIATTVIYSRFVVRERIRARLLIPALFRHAYQTAVSSGMTHGILAARPSLIPIFERFGFVAESTAFLDEIAGPMVIMKLSLLDRDRLVGMGALPDHDDFPSLRPNS